MLLSLLGRGIAHVPVLPIVDVHVFAPAAIERLDSPPALDAQHSAPEGITVDPPLQRELVRERFDVGSGEAPSRGIDEGAKPLNVGVFVREVGHTSWPIWDETDTLKETVL